MYSFLWVDFLVLICCIVIMYLVIMRLSFLWFMYLDVYIKLCMYFFNVGIVIFLDVCYFSDFIFGII